MLRDARGKSLLALLEFAIWRSVEAGGRDLFKVRVLYGLAFMTAGEYERQGRILTSVPNLFCMVSPRILLVTILAIADVMVAVYENQYELCFESQARSISIVESYRMLTKAGRWLAGAFALKALVSNSTWQEPKNEAQC
jgi:hypothetical protein